LALPRYELGTGQWEDPMTAVIARNRRFQIGTTSHNGLSKDNGHAA
jgi:hypothetical protein